MGEDRGVRRIRGVRVAVVGGAGFLGSHLVDHLTDDRDCKVLVVDNLVTGRLEFVNKKADFLNLDITSNVDRLTEAFKTYKTDYVFNYAAIPFVPSGFTKPLETFAATATSVLNVLVACEHADVKGLLQVGSAEIYQSTQGRISESDPIEPHSTYGVSKVAADGLVRVRWKEAGVPGMVMRQFNCYGSRTLWPYVIPEIISQLAEGPVVRLGNNSRRDFQFCGDAVRMAVELLEKGEWGETYNMGSEESILIYDLAEMIGGLMGHDKIEIVVDQSRVRPKDVEIWHLCSDNKKLYGVIGRRPETPLEDGLKKTIASFKENGNRWPYEDDLGRTG